jgi:mannose-1-phosphate guanylyltransferase/phosphomannomutase
MKAVVMAGGEGSRLRPLTLNRPKPMVPLVNRPVMAHIVELLKRHGLREIIATLQYRAEDIQNDFGDGTNFDISIDYSVEQVPLGTAGSVKYAEKYLDRAEPFIIIISGDALTDFNLSEILAFHQRVGALVTITLYHVPNPLEYGVIITGADGRIERFLEKPSWGEVISDTVNTGLYVLSPEVLDYIEPNTPFDFSKDLFPLLMQKGAPLYGYIASGYWCDVGDIAEYVRATGDVLSRRVQVGELGRHIGGEIYVEDDVEIAPDAQLFGPIFLGRGVRIKGGVVIHGPSVVRPFTTVDNRAHLDRAIVWRNAYIGEGVELRGAIIGATCSLKSRAVVFEGAVVGDDCAIGENAVVHPNVKIWPRKQIEAGATVKSSLIWGAQAKRTLFGRYGVTGLVNVDLTPEYAARLGAAFGATLPKGATVTMNRDPHRSPRMIKRAMISGLPSAGIGVADLKSVPIPVARYYTRVSGAAGGVHVRLSPYDRRTVDIRFFDAEGLNLSKAKERAIENVFFREDFHRVHLDEIGRIEDLPGVTERAYVEGFLKAVNVPAIRAAHFSLAIDYANAPTALVLPEILSKLGCNVVALNERMDESKMSLLHDQFSAALDRLAAITAAVNADLGARIDVGGERIWLVDNRGQNVPNATAAAAFVELALRAQGGGAIALPVNQPNLFDTMAGGHGTRVIRTRVEPNALTTVNDADLRVAISGTGEFVVPAFQRAVDGMFALVKLLELLATQHTTLAEVAAQLPPFYTASRPVSCPWERKGTVMRRLNERFKDQITEQVDGVKIKLSDAEWVLILPDPDDPLFHVHAESTADADANALADRYARMVEELRE